MSIEYMDKIREAAKDFFGALNADPGSLTLGPEVKEAAWALHEVLNPSPHDHQSYCVTCSIETDWDPDSTSNCVVCGEKYPDRY
jgi:hypothetical protein